MYQTREQLGKKVILNAAEDAQRKEAVALYEMAARPERTITTSKKFEKLRSQPWMNQLALLMIRFARSQDITRGTWPLGRFEQRLTDGGTPLPDGLAIEQAVHQVERTMAAADGRWFHHNIIRPLSRRLGSVVGGAESISELPRGESGTWIRATYRMHKEQALVHLHDAARRGVGELRELAKWHLEQAVRAKNEGDDKESAHQCYWYDVTLAAALVLEKLAQAKDFSELELILHDRSSWESEHPHDSTIVAEAAHQINPMLTEESWGFAYCFDIAREVRRQLLRTDPWQEDHWKGIPKRPGVSCEDEWLRWPCTVAFQARVRPRTARLCDSALFAN